MPNTSQASRAQIRHQPVVRTFLKIAAGLLLLGAAHGHPPDEFRNIARAATPSVVSIEIQERPRDRLPMADDPLFQQFMGKLEQAPDDASREFRPAGSGFVIDREGHVLTERSVVEQGQAFRVVTAQGRYLAARLVGMDAVSSVAVLQVDGLDAPPLMAGDLGDVAPGDWVMAIGAPFGLNHTVTVGVISAVSRSAGMEARQTRFIQADVSIQPGSGGGPLLDHNGRVIGMSAAIISRSGRFSGVSFFLPIDDALAVAGDLISHGRVRRGWLGIQIQDAKPELLATAGMADRGGALVSQVDARSPAAAAGLRAGDIVLRFNGEPVHEANDIAYLTARTAPGQHAKLEILRDGHRQQLDLILGEAPQPDAD